MWPFNIPRRKPSPPREPMPTRVKTFTLSWKQQGRDAQELVVTGDSFVVDGKLRVEVKDKYRLIITNLGKYGFRSTPEPITIEYFEVKCKFEFKVPYLDERKPNDFIISLPPGAQLGDLGAVYVWHVIPEGSPLTLEGNRSVAWEWIA